MPSSPDEISGMVAWFNGEDNSLGYSNGDPVNEWIDSFMGYSYVSNSYRPTFNTNAVNGKSALLFDDTDDYLVSDGDWLYYGTYPYTILVAFRKTTNATGLGRAISGSPNFLIGPYNGWATLHTGSYPGFIAGGDVNGYPYSPSAPISLGTTYICAVTNNGTNQYLFVNGTNTTSNSTNTASPDSIYFGAYSYTDPLGGYLCEALFYNQVLSNSDLTWATEYLATRWGASLNASTANKGSTFLMF